MNTIPMRFPERQGQVHRRLLIWLPLALLTLGPVALSETYESFDCPDSSFTEPSSINDRGDIVGHCVDANGEHGFVLRNGVFKMIDVPEGTGNTAAFGINNRGDVVGRYEAEGVAHGYLLRRGRFITIDPPGSIFTAVRGIDDLGRIVGFYLGSDDILRGFELDARAYRDIEFPGSDTTGAWDINALTRIVGGNIDASGVAPGFLLKNGVFTSIDPAGAAGARAFGINILGHIVGGWSGDPACSDNFTNAFLPTPRGFKILEFPTALETVATGINAVGQIVGVYFGQDEIFHGFRRDPDGFVLTARRTGGNVGAVDVDNATAADGAEPGFDFEDTSGTLAWNDGDADDKTMTINLIDDSDPERNESFLLSLSSPSGCAVLAAGAATTTIGNEVGPGNLSFDPLQNFLSRTEGESNIRVVVGRVNGSDGEVSVSYDVAGNATPGEDFVTSGTLTWADADTAPKFIDVDYLEDAVVEGTESFQIELTAPTGGATISSRRQNMIIRDNDEGFLLPDTAVSVDENAGTLQFAIARSGASNRAASVDYSTANGTAVAGSDYSAVSGTLTWAAGDSDFKTIEIPITNDQDDENAESFTVSLSNPTGGLALAPNSTASVTIVDNDTAGGGGGGGDGGGGAIGLELLALLGLLHAFAMRKRRWLANAIQVLPNRDVGDRGG